MSQEVSAFLRTKSFNNATYPAQQTWNCVLGCLSQMRLQFAEGHLDGVEVGRIGRQINEGRPHSFDRLLDAGDRIIVDDAVRKGSKPA
jgi:hypothetical protein